MPNGRSKPAACALDFSDLLPICGWVPLCVEELCCSDLLLIYGGSLSSSLAALQAIVKYIGLTFAQLDILQKEARIWYREDEQIREDDFYRLVAQMDRIEEVLQRLRPQAPAPAEEEEDKDRSRSSGLGDDNNKAKGNSSDSRQSEGKRKIRDVDAPEAASSGGVVTATSSNAVKDLSDQQVLDVLLRTPLSGWQRIGDDLPEYLSRMRYEVKPRVCFGQLSILFVPLACFLIDRR